MSAPGPQVLTRRSNGVPQPAEGKVFPPPLPLSFAAPANTLQGKASSAEAVGIRPSRAKGSGDRNTDATKNSSGTEPPRRSKPRVHDEGEKLVIRRLPPGMTMAECVAILGPDWELNKGKVDWLSYNPGKVSTDPSKPSRPSRAYLHLTRKDDIMALGQVVRSATWEDAKATFTNPSLVGPPSLEFSPYKKIPSNKRRTDPRQGTIDQDQEFMIFLEGLANPVPLRESIDIEDADEAKEEAKVTTTPLVEYLKEKKANKSKDSGKNAKSSKKTSSKDDDSKKRSKDSKADKSEKAPKETVRILSKKAATEQAADAAKNVASQISAAGSSDAPKSRRAGIAAAARILQRDLGLSPGSAHRRARHDAAKAEADAKAPSAKDSPTTSASDAAQAAQDSTVQPPRSRPDSPVAAKASQPSGRRARGGKGAEKGKAAEASSPSTSLPATTAAPVILKKKVEAEIATPATDGQTATPQTPNGKSTAASSTNTKAANSKAAAPQKKSSGVSPGATRAFVKHASASQGVTEAMLRQALEVFGAVTSVDMDKRKGFAYVDFAEHGGLVKAVAASPVQVAQTSIQILERKEKKPATTASVNASTGSTNAEKGSGRGRRGRGGGGGGNKSGGQGNAQSTPAVAPPAASAGG
ncbi:hypothetical protein JDV02_006358 [Purpureocillium takamizusanense]|uniref:RRM domain-containing protein n=1 Tax=Purpureocillium takamizusanense TaxID=2060973 RepID=A0A9Q8VB92_9HYPO|nr:uncharacterized protein JDV02_006358 [Purpureocillium takamizusanense]UNI20255.1 hypothetical protein JDV02_006358 [Purpureocillium takamizusanense]